MGITDGRMVERREVQRFCASHGCKRATVAWFNGPPQEWTPARDALWCSEHGPRHRTDADCTLIEDCCVGCGVLHGEPCPQCGGRGFHTDGCAALDAPVGSGGPVDGGRTVRTTDGRATDGRDRLTVRVTPDVFAQVDAAARADGRSRDAWIRRAINAALAREARRTDREADGGR